MRGMIPIVRREEDSIQPIKSEIFVKKGSFILAIILVGEIIYFFRFNTVFPASIICWSGTLRWEILVYWIIHIIVIFIILYRFYLQDTISYKSMFTVLLLYLIIRIFYDICMYIFLDHKTYGFYFILSKITFFISAFVYLSIFKRVSLCFR